MPQFYFRLPAGFYSSGPVTADSEADARRKIRELYRMERLPVGTDVWATTPEDRAATMHLADRFNQTLPAWARGPA